MYLSTSYSNNYVNLERINHNLPGKYRIRYANSASQKPGVHLYGQELKDEPCDKYQGFINSPTVYGGVVGRLLVKNDSSDIERVHATQNQTILHSTTRSSPKPDYKLPKLTTEFLNRSHSSDIPKKVLQLTARFAPFNPARNLTDQPRVENLLRKAGIYKG